jgi:signal transduction histidine kinase
MSHWEEMKDYVGFDADDEARLRAALPGVEPHLEVLAHDFYATIERFDGAASVFSGPEQVARLQKTLQVWVRQLLSGPWDDAYFQRRQRIGRVHVQVGLPERYVFTAMNRLRAGICDRIRAVSPEGPERWRTCEAVARITDLELAVMSGTYHEAHERRRLQTLQDLIVENLPVTVLVLDESGHVTSATHPSLRLFGERAEVGRHYAEFLPADLVEAADLPAAVAQVHATGRDVTLPRVVLGAGSAERFLRLTLVPLEHENARLLIHVEELTDVVQAEARVRQTEALARIGGMAAHMAHEIRNPLAAISATLQVIVGSLPEEDRRKPILGKVQDQVHRLDRLVSDLLGYARPTRVNLEPAVLRLVVAEAVQRSGVGATVHAPDPGAMALIDREYLLQVLINLIQNARDAAGVEGRVELEVGPGPVVTVRDDGPGVPETLRADLFEPFVTSKTRGTGLGLAICRKLVSSMGGAVMLAEPAADPAPAAPGRGPGAVFRVELAPVSG